MGTMIKQHNKYTYLKKKKLKKKFITEGRKRNFLTNNKFNLSRIIKKITEDFVFPCLNYLALKKQSFYPQ